MTTRLYHHPVCLEHVNSPNHPERPDRLRAIEKAISGQRFDALERVEAPEADTELFTLAHPRRHVVRVESLIPEQGLARIDADTSACSQSWLAVKRAVGGALAGVDDVFEKRADNVFASVRPPGHHAEKTTAMGFCLINSVAVAARYAQEKHGAERVAIVGR